MTTAEAKLYLVHCGYYDPEICEGIYEGHANLFVVAQGFEEARRRAREEPLFKSKRMHVDGVQEVAAVLGHRIVAIADGAGGDATRIIPERHRDL